MNGSITGPGSGPPPLHLARRTLRHAGLALLLLVAGVTATLLVARRTDQIWRSEAVLLYRQPSRQAYGESDPARRAGARLQDMLLARERLRRTADELGLHPEQPDRNAAVDEMRKKVGFQVRDGSTFVISFDAPSPALAQAVVARLAETLIQDNARHRAREAEETRRLLESEKQKLAEEVRAHEAAIADFLRVHPEAAFPRELLQAGGDPGGEIAALEAEIARLRGVPLPSARAERTDPEATAVLRRAELELAQARRELGERRERYTDVHPDVITARERLRQAEAHAAALRDSLAPGAGAGAPRAEGGADAPARIAVLEEELARLRRGGRVRRRPNSHALRVEVQLQSLRHELEQARDRLAMLEDREFQTALVAKLETNGELGQLSILDPASRPGLPLVNVRRKVALAGLVASLLLAVGAALLRARTDDRIHDRADAEWLAGQPVLVAVPGPERRRRSHG